ncbi:hypothetical protein ACLKA7_016639 [Drosophila subpalustris]
MNWRLPEGNERHLQGAVALLSAKKMQCQQQQYDEEEDEQQQQNYLKAKHLLLLLLLWQLDQPKARACPPQKWGFTMAEIISTSESQTGQQLRQ